MVATIRTVCLALGLLSAASARANETHTFNGRPYDLHLPPKAKRAKHPPLVLALHGANSNAGQMERLTFLDKAADKLGFVIVYPNAAGPAWNAGEQAGPDDVAYLAALLKHVAATVPFDRRRVFVAGVSNGGMMAYTLACRLPEVRAVGVVAGLLVLPACRPAHPVSVLHFHGDADRFVPYDPHDRSPGSVEATVAQWAAIDGCGEATPTRLAEDVTCTRAACRAGSAVEFCRIAGGGHSWPGGAHVEMLGRTSDSVNASEMALKFFWAH